METAGNSKFDATQWISKVLNYENYMRLMVLLFVLGLTAGLAYFVYSRAVYSSRALVKVTVFTPTTDEKGNKSVSIGRTLGNVRRSLIPQLNAKHMVSQTAQRIGFASKGTSFEEVRESAFPKIRVGILDEDYIEINTLSYFPEGVKEYPEALLAEYLENQHLLRNQYRLEAVERYTDELMEVRKKLDNKLNAKLKFEEESGLAEVHIKQNKLSEVPVKIVMAKVRLAKMDELDRVLRQRSQSLSVIEQLALLNSFETEEPIEVGKMVRKNRNGSAPVNFAPDFRSNVSTSVIVQPDMVEGLRSWEVLEKKKRELEEKIISESAIYGKEHPVIKALKSELKDAISGLNTELEVSVQRFALEHVQLKEQLSSMEKQLPEYHKIVREYDKQRLDYDLLDKSEMAWDQAHKDLTEKIAALEFGEGRKPVELEFAGFAELRNEDPISPNKMKLVIMGVVMGLAMAVGVPFVIEMFDDTAATLQQLESATGLTGIGVVPLTNQEDLEDIVRSPALGAKVPNFLLETFRVIRSNVVIHPGKNGMSQVVMVTSACPGEGKTTQAANLAWAFSSMGEKTLLVDCDLRRGRVHALTKINNEVGMTALLTSHVTEEDVMQSIGVEGLTVIPRGPVIPGTTEILCQERFEQLMTGWRKEYDRIIMDTPPVLGLSETVSLQRLADGLIVVVQAESTSRKDVVRAVELLRKGDAHFYGFVLNRIDLTRRANYYNYYYYSARYYDDFIDSGNVDVEDNLKLQGTSV